jgi:hypothetical protein
MEIKHRLSDRSAVMVFAGNCHVRSDGHAPALTLIQDMKRNSFGGLTPVKWQLRTENHDECLKAYPNLMSFVFTLKNPYNFPAREFAPNLKEKDSALCYPL